MKITIMSTILFFGMTSFAEENQQVFDVKVTDKGFEPSSLNVKPDVPAILKIKRVTDSTCATQISVPDKKIKKDLPLNQVVSIDLGKLEKGEIRFGCGMGMMMGGKIFIK